MEVGYKVTKKQMLKLIASEAGFESVDEMLERSVVDSVVPGICTDCYTVEENCEPDATENFCNECEANEVQSCLIIAGLI